MFNLIYEFKLKPTSAQIATFEEWLEQCCQVYNYALAERKDWVNSRKCQVNACSIKSEYIISVDAGWGQFLNILSGVYFQKVPASGTSQTCPKCLKETGKKKLSQRVHKCQHCGYTADRDVAAAQVVEIRGLEAVGHTVVKLLEGKGSILEDVKLCLPVKEESPAF